MKTIRWLRRWILRWEVIVGFTVLLLLAWFGTRAFLFDYFRVPTASMHPTIPAGSLILIDKRGFGNYGLFGYLPFQTRGARAVDRADIIVSQQEGTRAHYVQRVIDLPGDRITYQDKRQRINDRSIPLEFGTTDQRLQYATENIDGHAVTIAFMSDRYSRDTDVVVPAGQLFVLGDNRDNARDSRFIGFVPKASIIGRVSKVVQPPRDP